MLEQNNTNQLSFNFLERLPAKERIKELRSLCFEVDPYSGISSDQIEQLKRYGITDFSNPFLITNQLLMLLDEAEEELKIQED